MEQFNPGIFAIVHQEEEASGYAFLGTGFLADASGTLVSAKHVFEGIGAPDGAGCHIVDTNSQSVHPISRVQLSPDCDIAVGKITPPPGFEPLPIAVSDAPANTDILTIEFSPTHAVRRAGGRVAINIRSYCHKGHVLSYYRGDILGPPMDLLDLSFPALAGASGAPVVAAPTFEAWSVVGMVVGNVGRHLLPAHVARTFAGEDVVEEIRYYLPIGLAISWSHIRDFLDRVR